MQEVDHGQTLSQQTQNPPTQSLALQKGQAAKHKQQPAEDIKAATLM